MSDALDHLDGEESALGAEEMSKFREADLYLPINNIVRVMKEAIPPNVKIGKDSKDTVKYCVSEFISFITSQAADHCLEHNRKTISGDDILEALATLGLDLYLEPLQEYLRMYREAVHADSDSDSFSSGDGQSIAENRNANSRKAEKEQASSKWNKTHLKLPPSNVRKTMQLAGFAEHLGCECRAAYHTFKGIDDGILEETVDKRCKNRRCKHLPMHAGDATSVVTKACELFIGDISAQAWNHTVSKRRKIIKTDDVCSVLKGKDKECFDFLTDILPARS